MAHAEKCPICGGSGRVGADPNSTYPEPNQTCHGCNGKGWIEVGDTIPVFPTPLPMPGLPYPGSPPYYPVITYLYGR